jgi:hypothetical protein
MLIFGNELGIIYRYFMGIINVVTTVVLYNGKDLDQGVHREYKKSVCLQDSNRNGIRFAWRIIVYLFSTYISNCLSYG